MNEFGLETCSLIFQRYVIVLHIRIYAINCDLSVNISRENGEFSFLFLLKTQLKIETVAYDYSQFVFNSKTMKNMHIPVKPNFTLNKNGLGGY